MRYRITAIFYATAVVGAALATYGLAGLLLAAIVVGGWGVVFSSQWWRNAKAGGRTVFLAGFLLFVVAWAFVTQVVSVAGNSIRYSRCYGNMRQVELAILMYAEDQGCLPPAYVADEQGQPMHSWRVLILPYMGEVPLHRQYNFDEPWNGPSNRKLVDQMPAVFRCPCQAGERRDGRTMYVAVVGPSTVWPGAKSRKMAEIADKASRTLMLMESRTAEVCWLEPRDPTVDEFLDSHRDTGVPGGCCAHRSSGLFSYTCSGIVFFADGHGMVFWEGMPRDDWKAMLTVDDGESVEFLDGFWDGEPRRHWKWAKLVALAGFALFVLLPLAKLPRFLRELRAKKLPASGRDRESKKFLV